MLRVELLEDRSLPSIGFQPLAYLGDPSAGGPPTLITTNDFEPWALNNKGQAAYGNDLMDTSGNFVGEGVNLYTSQGTIALGRSGDPTPAPDNTTFGPGFLGGLGLNDAGDVSFAIFRNPQTTFNADGNVLIGDNAGVYSYNHTTGTVAPLVLPGEPAPGPEGGTFHGVGFHADLNNNGVTAFAGFTTPEKLGPGANLDLNSAGISSIGEGIYLIDAHGNISDLARPGDPVAGGLTLDWAQNPDINDNGSVAFGGHVVGDPAIQFNETNLAGETVFYAESVLYKPHNGPTQFIARIGHPAPDGLGNYSFAFGPQVNNSGQIAFFGAVPAKVPGTGHVPLDSNIGIFLYSKGTTTKIASEGDAMPGGGDFVTGSFFTLDMGLNDHGSVSFTAELDTSTIGLPDTGLYVSTNGKISLVARTGTVIPGVGTIEALQPPVSLGAPYPIGGAAINDRGQVLFTAVLTNGKAVLLLATPNGNGGGASGFRVGAASTQANITAALPSQSTPAATNPALLLGGARHAAPSPGHRIVAHTPLTALHPAAGLTTAGQHSSTPVDWFSSPAAQKLVATLSS